MTKNRLQFSLIIVSIIAMFICSCSPKSITKKDTQQDSANTQSNTPSINVDSMAATIDTTSYTNTSRYNEEDENIDKDEDYEDYDDDDAEDEYDDPFSQKTRHVIDMTDWAVREELTLMWMLTYRTAVLQGYISPTTAFIHQEQT